MKGYEMTAVIEARQEVKARFKKSREELAKEMQLWEEELKRNGIFGPPRP